MQELPCAVIAALAQCVQRCADMSSVVVRFSGLPRNPSLEAAVHRWVARLEALRFAICGADLVIEASRRHTTTVTLELAIDGGSAVTTAITHADPYVAIADAFRAARQRLLARAVIAMNG